MSICHWRLAILLAIPAGCGSATDSATRLAYDIEADVEKLGGEDGATHRIRHETPSGSGECTGPYKLQLDRVGAIVVNKAAGATLTIDLEHRGGRAAIVDVR
ncbi:MAG: hypothetical protein ACREVI_03710 [Steroidobacteraceae bacterium]